MVKNLGFLILTFSSRFVLRRTSPPTRVRDAPASLAGSEMIAGLVFHFLGTLATHVHRLTDGTDLPDC